MKNALKAGLIFSVFLSALVEGGHADSLPNVVFILADDMGYDSVSAFNDQLGGLSTPELDKMVSQGVYFSDAHSGSSVCTPTRYGLLTGRYCWRSRLKTEVLWTYGQPLIEADQLTLPELLKTAGYQTGMIGKWHLGIGWMTADGKRANGDLRDNDKIWANAKDKVFAAEARIDWSKPFEGGPCDHGFDYYFGVDLPNMAPYTWLENRHVVDAPTVQKPPKSVMFGDPGMMKEGWQLEDVLPSLQEKACTWISQAAKKPDPYFIYVPLTSPHTPISPSEEFAGKSGISSYVDFVMQTDHVVGKIIDAVEASGEGENTLIIFSSDNGTAAAAQFKSLENKGVNIRNHFRAQKGSIYEGGHRVPLIMRWPKTISAGTRLDQTVCLTDFLATFAEMTGRELKEHEGVDSCSLWPLMTGAEKSLPNHPHVVSHSYSGQFSIRDGEWKLVLPRRSGDKPELYNLNSDMKENENLADQYPERCRQMTSVLKGYVEEGRSTSGPGQLNHDGQISWSGLPF
jgi:arylsulfatase A-like enzyme